ncbi:MAG: hypothetical protein KAW12_17440 [Candidatus Aminicenantes bacterium]|nr:hypothetical protein [Candidatus Aminicenantes bacterium]
MKIKAKQWKEQLLFCILLISTIIVFLGTHAARTYADQSPDAPPAPPSQISSYENSSILPDYSGMALLEGNRFVVAHDYKLGQKEPRVSILTANPCCPPQLVPVQVDWSGVPRVANDLESVAAVPGKTLEFLLIESGSCSGNDKYKPVPCFIFRMRLESSNGRWRGIIKDVIEMPEYLCEVEGAACLKNKKGDLLLILGERGSSKNGKIYPARLFWGYLDLEKNTCDFSASKSAEPVLFKTCEFDRYRLLDDDIRSCSGIYIDKKNQLWISAAVDSADEGPFRSTVAQTGYVDLNKKIPIRLYDKPRMVLYLNGLKVEAIAAPTLYFEQLKTGARVLMSIGTDDERYGGTWRPLFFPSHKKD